MSQLQYNTIVDVSKWWADQDAAGQLADMAQCADDVLESIWSDMACVLAAEACRDFQYNNSYRAILTRAWEEADGSAYRAYRVLVS